MTAFQDLAHFIDQALQKLGLSASDCATLAHLMAPADLQGSEGHGVMRLPQYARRILNGGINVHGKPRIQKYAKNPWASASARAGVARKSSVMQLVSS